MGKVERVDLEPVAEVVRSRDEDVHAVYVDEAHREDPDGPEDEAGVLDCDRHGLDAGADVAFEQVDHRRRVP